MQAIQHGRTGTAITHFLQSGDDALIVRLADQLLEGYLANGMVSATPPHPPTPARSCRRQRSRYGGV